MKTKKTIYSLAIGLASVTAVSVHAQSMSGHDHGGQHGQMTTMQVTPTPAATAPSDPHAGHNMSQMDSADDITTMQDGQSSTSMPSTDPHAGHDMSQMDQGEMRMQGGSPPPDARDPHAYANGTKVGEGAYAVPGVPRLRLHDEHSFASLRAERLERKFNRNGDDSTAYDLQGWFGTTYNRFVIKAEGDVAKRRVQESRTELLWSRAIATHWDAQAGVRMDTGEGPNRQWLAFGVQGLAPYWFEVDATGYVGADGRTALRLEASYELLITQRLVLEPKVEVQAFGKRDPQRRVGSGLSEASAGLRLRYEFTRQFAPYIGIERAGSYGETADFVRAEGGKPQRTRVVAGLRLWF